MRAGVDLTEGPVGRHLIRLTLPSIAGSLAIIVFNVTDTFFVSRLGTDPLAAMGFTFPIVMVVGCIAMGLGMGTTSVLARAVGARDFDRAKHTATHGILLTILVVAGISGFGLVTIEPLFRALGAADTVMPHVRAYMEVWYWGAVAAIMPPVCDGCMRATGDMVRPLVVMCVCALVNVVLDPILIFGLLGFPAMGIKGAAVATVIARCCGMVTTLSFLHFHHRLVDVSIPRLHEVLGSWSRILAVGLPAAMTQLLNPLSQGFVTRLAATTGGASAVAAIAAGSRIESFAYILPMAFGIGLGPMMGQNWGAARGDRIDQSRRISNRLAVALGLGTWVLIAPFALKLAGYFSDESDVVRMAATYLALVVLGHAGQNLSMWTSLSLNSVGKSVWAALLNVARVLVLFVPAAFVGRSLYGFTGMIAGMAAANLAAGLLAFFMGRSLLRLPVREDLQ
ncbi:MAG: MATE family efflux transporter [bacterium]|nr:MATE family efflux transporter [bacterium]